MQEIISEFHPAFFKNFTQNELEVLLQNAISYSKTSIVIVDDKYTFELEVRDNQLNISCDDNDSVDGEIQKLSYERFMELYTANNSSIQTYVVEMDE